MLSAEESPLGNETGVLINLPFRGYRKIELSLLYSIEGVSMNGRLGRFSTEF